MFSNQRFTVRNPFLQKHLNLEQKMSILCAVLLVIIKQVNSYDDSYGHYDDEGTQCTLQSQSPIDIEFDDLPECSLNNEYPNEIYLDLKLRDPSLTKFIVKNDGYSLYAIPFTAETDNPKEIHEIHILHESDQAVFSFDNPLSGTYESNTNTRMYFYICLLCLLCYVC